MLTHYIAFSFKGLFTNKNNKIPYIPGGLLNTPKKRMALETFP